MKKLNLFLLSMLCAFATNAATNISTASVSGHWTTAGSPYLVYNDLTIDMNDSLIIDPGVSVIFQGAYSLTVNGQLYAVGTAADRIIFTISDTTGRADSTIAAGGWHGMTFSMYGGATPDRTELGYCDVTNTKFHYDYVYSATPGTSHTLELGRSIKIKNCNIYNNKATLDMQWPLVDLYSYSSTIIEFTNCDLYNNVSMMNVCQLTNVSGGHTSVTNCKFHENSGGNIIGAFVADVDIENNEFYNNVGTCLSLGGNHAKVKNNKIHHNVIAEHAAVECSSGIVELTNNMICNNQQTLTSLFCGAVDGGAGLTLTSNGSADPSAVYYRVSNNIIANNFAGFHGGGINIFYARSEITNNIIANNSSDEGAGIYFLDTTGLVIKNNIFYGNTSPTYGTLATFGGFYDMTGNVINHNWADGSWLTMAADTVTNLHGTSPGFTAPTATAGVAENAITADFTMLTTSPCINKGDTTGTHIDSLDLAGHARVSGTAIDMGPYERQETIILPQEVNSVSGTWGMTAYPNPATNVLTVNVTTPMGSISLTDIAGRQVMAKPVTGSVTALDLGGVAPGMYLLNWMNNGAKVVKKIVVE